MGPLLRSLRAHSWLGLPILSVVVLALPALGLSDYWLRQSVQIAIFYLLASSLNLVLGYAGELALSQVAIMATGAYTTAILFDHGNRELIWAMLIAIAIGVAVSFVTGLPSIRLSSWTLGLVSFFLVLLLPGLVTIFDSLTGGLTGIAGLFNPTFLGIELSSPTRYFLFAASAGIVWTVAMRNLIRSRFGVALQNMRESPLLSTSLGISALRLRLLAYVISSVPAAVAGCIYTYYAAYVSPEAFNLDSVIEVLAAGVVGGLGSIYGALIGAVLLVIGPLRAASFEKYSLIIYGGFLLVVAVAFPTGVVGAARRLWQSLRDRLTSRSQPPAAAVDTADAQDPSVLEIPGERLEVTGVTKRFGGVMALDGAGFVAEAGKVTALIGPNGAGKTTLLNSVSGFIPIDAGVVEIGDRRVSGLPAEQVARLGLGRTFQTPMIPRSLSVREVVESGRLGRGRLGLLAAVLRLPAFVRTRRTDREHAMRALRFAGLAGHATVEAGALPLGTRRLLEVTRAVVSDPRVVLLDEPAAGLDDAALADLDALIRHMRDAGATVVLVEHNVPFVMNVADQVYVLDFGAVVANGSPEEVRNDPKVIAAYFGGGAGRVPSPPTDQLVTGQLAGAPVERGAGDR